MGEEQESKEIKITYESVYDLCRRERERDEIQELPETFLEDVEVYLAEKRKAWQKYGEKQDIFSQEAQEKTLMHIKNVKKILKQLYERRESKIINLALNKSRTQSPIIDTSNLLDTEKDFYIKLEELFSDKRIEILGRIVEGVIRPEPPAPVTVNLAKPAEEEKSAPVETITLKITSDVPAFMGPELEQYGPYTTGETKILPAQIANILLKNGQAKQE